MKSSSQIKEADRAVEIHLYEKQKSSRCQWIKIEDQRLLQIQTEDQQLFRHKKKRSLIMRIRIKGFQTMDMREKATTGRGRARKQSQKLWEKMWLSLNLNKMLKINLLNMTMKQLSSTCRLIKMNTSIAMNITWEIQTQRIITQARFLKIKEKMMRRWDKLIDFLQKEATTQSFIQTLYFDKDQSENLFGKKKNEFENWPPKRLSNSYILLKITKRWKTLFGQKIKVLELNFETKDQSNLSFGIIVKNQKYPYFLIMPLTLKTHFWQET